MGLIYLISGASRGFGYIFAKTFLSRPDTTVIAAVRSPKEAGEVLGALPKGDGSRLVVVKVDSLSDTDADEAARELQEKYSIAAIDVIIANAGGPVGYGLEEATPVSQVQSSIDLNTHGMKHLLLKSSAPKFLLMGSEQGSIGGLTEKNKYPLFSYGLSKAAAHYFINTIHIDYKNQGLCAWAVDAGFARTDGGNKGAIVFGMKEAVDDPEEVASFVIKQIDEASQESASGTFPSFHGGMRPW